jgi:hypothetical protein
MNQLEYITELYESVPKDKRDAFIAEVAESAAQYQHDTGLSPEQMAELKRRLADPNPRYATDAEMREAFGGDYPK